MVRVPRHRTSSAATTCRGPACDEQEVEDYGPPELDPGLVELDPAGRLEILKEILQERRDLLSKDMDKEERMPGAGIRREAV